MNADELLRDRGAQIRDAAASLPERPWERVARRTWTRPAVIMAAMALAVAAVVVPLALVRAGPETGAGQISPVTTSGPDPVTEQDVGPPAAVLRRLRDGLGLSLVAAPDDTPVGVSAAAIVVEADRQVGRGAFLPDEAEVAEYLLHVDASTANEGFGLTEGDLVWLIHYSGFEVTGGEPPQLPTGEPAEAPTMSNAYVLINAVDGQFVTVNWTN